MSNPYVGVCSFMTSLTIRLRDLLSQIDWPVPNEYCTDTYTTFHIYCTDWLDKSKYSSTTAVIKNVTMSARGHSNIPLFYSTNQSPRWYNRALQMRKCAKQWTSLLFITSAMDAVQLCPPQEQLGSTWKYTTSIWRLRPSRCQIIIGIITGRLDATRLQPLRGPASMNGWHLDCNFDRTHITNRQIATINNKIMATTCVPPMSTPNSDYTLRTSDVYVWIPNATARQRGHGLL